MADTYTAVYNLLKPEVGASRDTWGQKYNANLDKLDDALKAIKDVSDAAKKAAADNATALANLKTVPPGTIAYFAMTTPPEGWLKCNGASLSRTAYAALFAAIGGTFGAADGNSFSLPDVRGYFLRVLDDGRGVDGGRTIGSYQETQNLAHTHGPSQNSLFVTNGSGAYVASGEYLGLAGSTSSSGGNEARPRNLSFPMFIKY